MMFLLNLVAFLVELIVCPILMIPYLMWRLLVNIFTADFEMRSENNGDTKAFKPTIEHSNYLQPAA